MNNSRILLKFLLATTDFMDQKNSSADKNHAGEIAVTVIYCRHRRGAIYQFYIITPRNFIHKRRESEFHHRRAVRNYTHMNNLASCAHLEGSHLKIAIIRRAHPSPQDESENFAEWCKKLKRHAALFYITLAHKRTETKEAG